MMIVPYDENFDRKVQLGAEAILKARQVPQDQWSAQLQDAQEQARMVLLTAKAIDAGQLA
jgi:hypothetical protein